MKLFLFKSFQKCQNRCHFSWYKLFKILIRINLTKGVGIFFFFPSSPTFSPVLIIPNSQPSSWFLFFFQLLFWSPIRPHILSYLICQPSAPSSPLENPKQYSVQFSHSLLSESLWPHGLQHPRLPCPSPTPRACSNSCPLSRWCHPVISSSVVPFYHLQSFPA